MQQYMVTLTGVTPLLMHHDNLAFGEKVSQWRNDPGNKEMSLRGDDRSPGWTWLGYAYHDGKHLGLPSDNLMTLLREGGAKVRTGKGTETYKKHTQSGLMIEDPQWALYIGGEQVPIKPIWDELMGLSDPQKFYRHIEVAEDSGFELLVKRALVGQRKHVRVRPMFREWTAVGTVTVMDEETSGLNRHLLTTILEQAGTMVGTCDWRPGSPKSPGPYGKFTSEVIPL